ncbi:carboxypeptidase-like regulatory domain-containing protein [Patescibacteria group bacterium]|nr:carboxypeptidase-like regulatory domain-containing protein [Patescibacteria group bacterium]MCG2701766.1 carboxypeptidase-like regulatory domain-containing protein [Candidatus Parcubacteria bacterium]MBU4264671.1 carboxypeptidase-like regulatory domain-containing protein [Patescibacteria group bacterium]MBU4390626.1 carboxypeptidase-like regulatory domain-containing protein [Patescibacteria group bacterium]MBU4431022.1 carboxypeptidase-like regulatory domain-containing protein [Patescibacter
MKKIIKLFTYIVVVFSFFLGPNFTYASNTHPELWPVRSIDTMKTSRDKARAELNNPDFDTQIEKELTLIKEIGANYVAIDTPYDKEFLPFLKRWISLARKMGLKVWFRGNWSNWEGWFEYEKNMTPQEHIRKTVEFIETNPDLFEDGDAFDPCPECENSGWWKQPQDDEKYNQFIQNQRIAVKTSFSKIKKDVHSNWFSIIGGRAKEVLNKKTFKTLDNLVTIDHYIKDPLGMGEYIDYFSQNFDTKVLLGEFGAPIPDINGDMDETEQAEFINQLFIQFYKHKDNVLGMNYWVITDGTTSLLNSDGTTRQAFEIIKNYYIPGVIKGTIKNTLGDRLKNISIKTSDGLNSAITDRKGSYKMIVPAGDTTILINQSKYDQATDKITISHGSEITKDIILTPKTPSILYKLRLFLKKKFNL